MRVIVFTGERFVYSENKFGATQTSVRFIQELFTEAEVHVAGSVDDHVHIKEASSIVKNEFFHELPNYVSTKDFIIKALTQRKYFITYIQKIDDILSETDYDLVWIRTPSIGSIIFGLRALKFKLRLVNHICANIRNTWRNKKYKKVEALFGFIVSRFLQKLLSHICANKKVINLTTGSELENFSRKYSPEQTFQFVDMLISERETMQLTTLEDKKKLSILYIGRVVEDKGVFDLVDAVAETENVRLDIVGGGPALEQLFCDERVHESASISLHGQVPHEVLGKYLELSDVVCVPSKNQYEGFPRVIMEAWVYGKPVIVSNVGGISAFVEDGINGIVIPPGSKQELRRSIYEISQDAKYKELAHGANCMSKISSKQYWLNTTRDILNVS